MFSSLRIVYGSVRYEVTGSTALCGHADVAVLPRVGHLPWVDDPASSTAIVDEFL